MKEKINQLTKNENTKLWTSEKRIARINTIEQLIAKVTTPVAKTNERLAQLMQEKKVLEYLNESLPESEQRIETPMDPQCDVAVVIPVYGERDYILRPLASLAEQKGVSASNFEVIFVINNPATIPVRASEENDEDYARKVAHYHKAVSENKHTIELLHHINKPNVPMDMTEKEARVVVALRAKKIRVHVIDKATEGHTLATGEANVGGARNRGVAEAVARFYENNRKNGVIAQTDADTRMDPMYIRGLIDVFNKNPEVVGVAGALRFDEPTEDFELFKIMAQYKDLQHYYFELINFYSSLQLNNEIQTPFEENNVSFSGANMASRAFEAAMVGGVPKIPGGEDPAFGKRLAKIGSIIYAPGVSVHTTDRFSPRTQVDAGHGQQNIRFAELLKQKKSPMVNNPERIVFDRTLRQKLEKLLTQKTITPESLKSIFQYNSVDLLSEDDLRMLSEKFTHEKNINIIKNDPEVQPIGIRLMEKFETLFPEVTMEQAGQLICEKLCEIPELAGLYATKRQEIFAEEAKSSGRREKLIQELLPHLWEIKPKTITPKVLLSTLTKYRDELGLDDERIAQIGENKTQLASIAKIFDSSSTDDEVFEKLRITLPHEFVKVADSPLKTRIFELRAMLAARDGYLPKK